MKKPDFKDFLGTKLSKLAEDGLYRNLSTISRSKPPYVIYNGKKVVQMSSNDYLNLSNDERLIEAAVRAAQKYGIGSTGSRLISGTHPLHTELEEKIAALKNTERALVFSTGYAANYGCLTALLTDKDAVYSDELNHASIIDGIKTSKAEKFIYKHSSAEELERLLSENSHKYRLNLIVTDSIFSMDGDRALLAEIAALKEKYGAVLMIDDAHAFGIYGSNGEGLGHELGIQDKIDIHMGTLSKAAGSEGGYIAGSKELIEYLINKSRSFIYSTAPSIPSIAASIKAVEIIKTDKHLREKLHKNINYFKTGFEAIKIRNNINIGSCESAIFCVKIPDSGRTMDLSAGLLEEYGIIAAAIRPPTVRDSRLRVTVSAAHEFSHLEYFLDKLCLLNPV